MSDAAPPQLPPAGWYAHPQDATRERWWSGSSWTEHFRSVAPALPAPPAAPAPAAASAAGAADLGVAAVGGVPTVAAAPAFGAPPQGGAAVFGAAPQPIAPTHLTPRQLKAEQYRAARRRNIFGYLGCVFGLIAFILDLFAAPSILAIIFASIGIATARRLGGGKGTGLGWSISGLVLGIVSLCLFVWNVRMQLGGLL